MKSIRHQEVSRDSLYTDLAENLDLVYSLWLKQENRLRFSIPILCAIKLEAFINVAGKRTISYWDILERKLSFQEKCKIIFTELNLKFDPHIDPNKTAVGLFDIRNALVHPKMKLEEVDEYISREEYERRRNTFPGVTHPMRDDLSPDKIKHIKTQTDEFVSVWGAKLLDGQPSYWLSGGSTGSFIHESPKS